MQTNGKPCPYCGVPTYFAGHVCKSNIRRFLPADQVRTLVQMHEAVEHLKAQQQQDDSSKRAG